MYLQDFFEEVVDSIKVLLIQLQMLLIASQGSQFYHAVLKSVQNDVESIKTMLITDMMSQYHKPDFNLTIDYFKPSAWAQHSQSGYFPAGSCFKFAIFWSNKKSDAAGK